MSMTITLSIDDEEHILMIDPGDNLADVIRNIMGSINNCSFIVNGKETTSLNDLSKELHDNTRITAKGYTRDTNATQCDTNTTRAAYTSLGPRGSTLKIVSRKSPSRPTIEIGTVHISCSSDLYNENDNMAGVIVYSFDNKEKFELNGHRCRTGYILIKATKNIAHVKSNQGIVHGSLFKWFFGIEPDDRFVGAGFSLHERKFKFNSGVFNSRNDDYHDNTKSMSADEIYLIKYSMKELYISNMWKSKSTMPATFIDRSRYDPGDNLPPQNQPKSE
jgi:hypothetical protein